MQNTQPFGPSEDDQSSLEHHAEHCRPVVAPGLLLFVLRPVPPDWVFVVSRNASVSAAAILFLEATLQWRGFRPRVSWTYARGSVVVLAMVHFHYVRKNLNVSVGAMSELWL